MLNKFMANYQWILAITLFIIIVIYCIKSIILFKIFFTYLKVLQNQIWAIGF